MALAYAETERRIATLGKLIGNTPMLVVRCRYRGKTHRIFAKHEVCNFTGSTKDRMAYEILVRAYADGEIEPGFTIAEATSGNTGISFSALGRALGHPVRIYMPDWMSRERVMLIQSFGARIVPVSADEGGFVGSITRADEFAAGRERVFLPHQFQSKSNVEAHRRTTGPEILAQMEWAGRTPTAFVAGVGTGGTVMGVGASFRDAEVAATIHPLEPANSPTLRTGHRVGKHRIQGISDEFIPPIVDLGRLDEIVDVWDGDAILMAQRLAAELGLAVGISSGANLLGALTLAHLQGADAAVATVFPDSNKKYLSTDLCGTEPLRADYRTPEIELLDFEVLPPLSGEVCAG